MSDTIQISVALLRNAKETFGSAGVQTPESSYRFEREKKKDERHIFSINSGMWGSILQLTSIRRRVYIMAHNHLVHPASCTCGKSELELFSIPPTQTAIESSQWVEYRPITTLSDSSPIEFVITGSGEEYADLSESYLQVTAKILKANGGDLVQTKSSDGTVTRDDADVGPVNLWLHSLFSQVDVSLNERLVHEHVPVSSLSGDSAQLWTCS